MRGGAGGNGHPAGVAPDQRDDALSPLVGHVAGRPRSARRTWLLTGGEASIGVENAVEATGPATDGARRTTTLGIELPTIPQWSLSLLALVWFAWAAVSLSRTLGALVSLRRAKRTARPFPAAREVRLQTWLSLRAQGRRAALGVSDSVRAAAVLGLTSPSIVVAPSVLRALDDPELDQIVVHEWAHVQRRDDLARLVQRIIVALAGLHPAIWWIDRQLNLERETACDDWAVNATGSAKSFAVCLTKLAALPGRPADAVLLPAALLSSELTTRVVRLLDGRRNTSTTRIIGAPMLIAPGTRCARTGRRQRGARRDVTRRCGHTAPRRSGGCGSRRVARY